MNNQSGEDPIYSDDFVYIKQEIEKLGDVDYAKIAEHCEKILNEQAKDMRVAGYNLLAQTYINGAQGFLQGLQIYQTLLDTFKADCHPQRETAKISALKWLNNEKILSFLQSQDLGQAIKENIQEAIKAFNQTCQALLPVADIQFNILNGWLREQVIQVQEQQPEEKEKPQENKKIESVADLDAATYQIIQELQSQNKWQQAAAFARALRWGDMQLPPHTNQQTLIPAPRKEALTQFEQIVSSGDCLKILNTCEALFLEPGGHVWLDLQCHAYQAAINNNDNDYASFLAGEMKILSERMPSLAQLSFANGVPFADTQTRGWVDSLQKSQNDVVINSIEPVGAAYYLQQAKAEAKKQQLIDLLRAVQKIPAITAQQQFHQQHALAKLCLQYKRADLAMPLFEKLNAQLAKQAVESWEPNLALTLCQESVQSLTLYVKVADDATKPNLEQNIRQLQAKICQLDVVSVV